MSLRLPRETGGVFDTALPCLISGLITLHRKSSRQILWIVTMGDPLSVAASIVGILAAAAKIVEIVQPFISDVSNAPKIALTIHTKVSHIQLVLKSLRDFLQNLATPSSSGRASFVQVDHIIILFTDGVILFSELEFLLSPLKLPNDSHPQTRLRQRMLWASKKNAISEAMARMQAFLTSLSAVLNIFQW